MHIRHESSGQRLLDHAASLGQPALDLLDRMPHPASAGGLIRDSLPLHWAQNSRHSLIPGTLAALAVFAAITLAGRRDSGSAIAPINATSHVIWGDRAAAVERPTLRHTLPGVLINLGSSMWWALVFRKLFGRAVDHRGAGAAMAGGVATAGLAYCVDYHLMPKRLTPGWEKRISNRSLLISMVAMGVGLGLGAIIARRG